MNSKLTAFVLLFISIFSFTLNSQPTTWQNIGPGGGGAFYSPSISPYNPNEIFFASDMSDLFHTTDLGNSYSIVNFQYITAGGMTKVQFTNNQKILYTINQNEFGNFPVVSTDAGITWKTLKSDPTDGGAYQIFASDQDYNKVIVTDYTNVYYSNDGGNSFKSIFQGNSGTWGSYIAGVFWDSKDIYVVQPDGVLYTMDGNSINIKHPGLAANEYIVSASATKGPNGIVFYAVTNSSCYPGITGADHGGYKSVLKYKNGDNTFTPLSANIPSGIHPFFVESDKSNPNVVYIAGYDGNSYGPSVIKSTDAGNTWTNTFKLQNNQNIKTGWSGFGGDRNWSYGEYALGFAVSSTNSNYAIFTDLGFAHITTDGGSHWEQIYVNKSDANNENASITKGKTYRSVGLENTSCWNMCWADDKNIFAGYTDIQGCRSSDGGNSWSFDYTGHNDNTMYMSIKHPQTGILYAATSSVHDMYESMFLTDSRIDGGRGKVLFSTDKGKTWQILHDFGKPVIWLALDPNNPNKMYASMINSSQGGIYVCNDISKGAASQWTKLGVPPRTQGHPYNIVVLKDGSLVCTYSGRMTNDRKSFLASSGVFLSNDGGTTWQDKSDANMQYWTKDIFVDPNDPKQNTWYVGVFSGWGGAANNKGGLYKTTNRGTSWIKILDKARIESCTINPANPNEMYVTTEYEGLFLTDNLNTQAPVFKLVQSYPFKHPMRVFFNPYNNNEIYITSFGYGIVRGTAGFVQPPAIPNLLSPLNNTSVKSDSKAIFTWNKSAGAEKYTFTYADNDNFTNSFSDSTLQDSAYTITDLTSFSNKTISWKVMAGNSSSWSQYSPTWHLIITPATDVKETVREILIYPNPTEDLINIKLDNIDAYTHCVIYNSIGQQIFKYELNNYHNDIIVDIREFKPGIYFIQFNNSLEAKDKLFQFIKH